MLSHSTNSTWLRVIGRAGSNPPMVPMIFHNAKGTGSNSRSLPRLSPSTSSSERGQAPINRTARGVQYRARALVGVMGIQPVRDVDLIRHAYVRPASQRHGVGGALLEH